MNFINNQINTAMMKKLLFAGTAVLALSATAVQAETVTNGGVTYSYTLPDNITWIESNDKESATLTTGTDAVSSGYLTVTGTFTTTKTATATINPTATAVAAASVDFSSWSDNTTFKGNRVQNNNTAVYVGDNVYNFEIQRIIKAGNVTLYTWNEVVDKNDANNIYGFYEDETAGWTNDEESYSKDNTDDFESMYDGSYGYPDYNDLYFSRVATTKTAKGKTTTTVKYYAIYKLVDQTTNNIDSTLTVSFTPTAIPAGVITANVKSLTIGSNITSIDNNAFENATGITYVDAEGDYIDVNNTYLYTADKTTLRFIGKNYASEALEVTDPTTVIGSYATVGFENNQVIYYNSTTTTLNTTGQAAVFVDKNPHIDWISTSSDIYVAAATSYVDYNVLNSELSTLTNTTSCVDLRNVVLAGDISLRVNYGNIMVILPNDQSYTVGGTNVIYLGDNGYVCDKLVLSDNYRTKAYYSPMTFTATVATYDREFTSNNSTVCLPFELESIPTGFTVGAPIEDGSNEYCVNFGQTNRISANVPLLIFTDGQNRTLSGTNVLVKSTITKYVEQEVLNHKIIGRFSPITIAGNTGKIYAFKNNSLVRIGDDYTLTVNTFRCYLTSTSGNAAEIRFTADEEFETNGIEELEATNDNDAAVYNLNGQKIDNKAAGFQILSNGTKRIIK